MIIYRLEHESTKVGPFNHLCDGRWRHYFHDHNAPRECQEFCSYFDVYDEKGWLLRCISDYNFGATSVDFLKKIIKSKEKAKRLQDMMGFVLLVLETESEFVVFDESQQVAFIKNVATVKEEIMDWVSYMYNGGENETT